MKQHGIRYQRCLHVSWHDHKGLRFFLWDIFEGKWCHINLWEQNEDVGPKIWYMFSHKVLKLFEGTMTEDRLIYIKTYKWSMVMMCLSLRDLLRMIESMIFL